MMSHCPSMLMQFYYNQCQFPHHSYFKVARKEPPNLAKYVKYWNNFQMPVLVVKGLKSCCGW